MPLSYFCALSNVLIIKLYIMQYQFIIEFLINNNKVYFQRFFLLTRP